MLPMKIFNNENFSIYATMHINLFYTYVAVCTVCMYTSRLKYYSVYQRVSRPTYVETAPTHSWCMCIEKPARHLSTSVAFVGT